MIVKVVPRDEIGSPVLATYFDIGKADVSTGLYFFHEPPKDRKYTDDIADAFYVHVIAVEDKPDKDDVERGLEQWKIRFAYWYDGEEGRTHLVVTSGSIYLMSERGDTIDRV